MLTQFNELIDMLGAPKVATLLCRFGSELATFESQPLSATEAKVQAHRLISQAGMLGFDALSQAARHFEDSHTAGAPSDDVLRSEIAAARQRIDLAAHAMIGLAGGSAH